MNLRTEATSNATVEILHTFTFPQCHYVRVCKELLHSEPGTEIYLQMNDENRELRFRRIENLPASPGPFQLICVNQVLITHSIVPQPNFSSAKLNHYYSQKWVFLASSGSEFSRVMGSGKRAKTQSYEAQ